MSPLPAYFCALLMLSVFIFVSSPEAATKQDLYLFMSEIQAGSMQSQQYCALVFEDHRFHYEKASRRHGRDLDRRIYEGELSETDWNTLFAALNTNEFRDLKVSGGVPPLVMQESHVFTISVARQGKFQSMEFLDNKSRKPYESQLKPLLQWWKSFRGEHMAGAEAVDPRCSPDNAHAVYSQ